MLCTTFSTSKIQTHAEKVIGEASFLLVYKLLQLSWSSEALASSCIISRGSKTCPLFLPHLSTKGNSQPWFCLMPCCMWSWLNVRLWFSSMERLGKPIDTTVTSLFPGLSTQNTLSNRLLYVALVPFYSFNCPLCDMHEQSNVSSMFCHSTIQSINPVQWLDIISIMQKFEIAYRHYSVDN